MKHGKSLPHVLNFPLTLKLACHYNGTLFALVERTQMKVKSEIPKPPPFNPVTITLETPEEVAAMYCLFNHSKIIYGFLIPCGKFRDDDRRKLLAASEACASYHGMFHVLEKVMNNQV